ncbi:winged helix DNA-binding protein [Oryzihumus leptocrescens]|uniref:Winged helix DNA-binding protein n=2 Tax=Oryzihumus leptocrescens TaxID=297536 RepID=A0A542ZK64_9MICO|nr:winged helix DNA-binding domain-containing protein [Oryzihumus leptocrescens]TQL60747.1 winged helix DNA-binding protein [Oryzihumus leptocrescens]
MGGAGGRTGGPGRVAAPSAVHRRRLAAQQLSGPAAGSAEAVVERLLAVQGQDPRGARLAVRARAAGVIAADVDAGLTDRRSLVVTWLNRGTLHLVQAQDYWWLHPLTTPQLATGNRTRLRQEGVSVAQAERGVEVVAEQVATHGPRTRAELRDALDAEGVPTAGQAIVHVLVAATLAGHVVRGPVRGAEQCFVSVEQWLGPAPEPLERTEALALLARRYLVGHGPADARDLAKWAGITLGDARRGLAAIADEVVEDGDGLVDLSARQAGGEPEPPPGPRLLGPFDPVLHGWVSRADVVGEHRGIVTTNGLFRPFAMVDGRAVALWSLAAGAVTIRPLEPVRRADLTALEADAARVLDYLGLPERPPVIDAG